MTNTILITTQAVDQNDPVMGFMCNWISEFANEYERVTVICLKEGEHDLPSNVHIFSLGKETRVSRTSYILNFIKYAWQERNNYNKVFSHMNPHYLAIYGLVWRIQGKRLSLWRNHPHMNLLTRIAAIYAHAIFHTSPHACTAIFKHAHIMPVGIDTKLFFTTNNNIREKNSILMLGRISPIKHNELGVEILRTLQEKGVNVRWRMYGNAPDGQTEYLRKLKESTADLQESQALAFPGPVKNTDSPVVYNRHELFINLTPQGSGDKTIFEAALCGCLVLMTSSSFGSTFSPETILKSNNSLDISQQIEQILSLSEEKKEQIRRNQRKSVEDKHSLRQLIKKVHSIL